MAASGFDGVLYKRTPPPLEIEPQEDDDPRPSSPTSPPWNKCYPDSFGSMTDHVPDDHGLNTLRLSDDYDDDDDYLDQNPNNALAKQLGSMADHTPDDYGFKTPDRFDGYDDRLARSPNYDDDDTFTAADLERQTNRYVTATLDHYNSQEQNHIKYELVRAITSVGILDQRGFYGHVNFTAKSSLDNSKEEFLFAELYYDSDSHVYKPACIVSLEGRETVGGVRGIESGVVYRGNEIRVDTHHCYACVEELKHPKDGTLYESGHNMDDLYGYL